MSYAVSRVGSGEGPLSITIDQLHVVGIYHFLKAQNFPEFFGLCRLKPLIDFISKYIFKHQFPKNGK